MQYVLVPVVPGSTSGPEPVANFWMPVSPRCEIESGNQRLSAVGLRSLDVNNCIMKTVIDGGSVNSAYSSNIGRQLTVLGTDTNRDCGTWESGRPGIAWSTMV